MRVELRFWGKALRAHGGKCGLDVWAWWVWTGGGGDEHGLDAG